MKKISTEFNPDSDSVEEHFYDEDTGTYTTRSTWRYDELVAEKNKRTCAEGRHDNYRKDGLHQIASIDNRTVLNLKREHNIDVFNLSDPENKKRFFQWLRDPENRYWKTTNRKV